MNIHHTHHHHTRHHTLPMKIVYHQQFKLKIIFVCLLLLEKRFNGKYVIPVRVCIKYFAIITLLTIIWSFYHYVHITPELYHWIEFLDVQSSFLQLQSYDQYNADLSIQNVINGFWEILHDSLFIGFLML